MSCDICVYADEHGSWPTTHKGTHCADTGTAQGLIPGCHRSWAGKREAHCTVCHAHFSADSLAEKHHRKGVCLTREEMLETHSKAGIPVFGLHSTPNGEIWRGGATAEGEKWLRTR